MSDNWNGGGGNWCTNYGLYAKDLKYCRLSADFLLWILFRSIVASIGKFLHAEIQKEKYNLFFVT